MKLNYPTIKRLFIAVILFFQGASFVSHATSFSTEQQLTQNYESKFTQFWQQGEFSHFKGVDNINIHYANFINKEYKKCLIIASGRSESYLKFKELIYDFFQQGFNVFILDHRGQGLSQRMLTNPQKGYVKNFDDYADDLHTFINDIVLPACYNINKNEKASTMPLYMLSHSMGGAISVRYLQKYTNSFKAVVLSSPMIAFNNGGLPSWFANFVIKNADKINQGLGQSPWYFIGQKNYLATHFKNNPLTHSKVRFQYFIALYQQHPEIQLGGVTIHWLAQAINTTNAIFANLTKLKSPILVIQSGGDSIVDNEAQNKFCAQLHQLNPQSCPDGKPIIIDNAKHELFLERDTFRAPALQQALNWFNQHTYTNLTN